MANTNWRQRMVQMDKRNREAEKALREQAVNQKFQTGEWRSMSMEFLLRNFSKEESE